jgi:putative ABC transport system substrate-binding protein
MRRREFITLLGGAAVWPLAARAQQAARLARIGYLGLTSASVEHAAYGGSDVFLTALRDLGYVEGRNLHIEFRFSGGDEDRLAGLAAELVALNVDVIVTYATGVNAAQRATATIPIVAATAGDMAAMSIVASLAHRGGNITGSTFFVPELYAKRLELLREVVPSMTRAGLLLVRNNPSNLNVLEAMGATAKALKVELQPIEVGKVNGIRERIFDLGRSTNWRACGYGSRAVARQRQCDRRPRRKAPLSFDRPPGIAFKRWAGRLRGELFRHVSPCRFFR